MLEVGVVLVVYLVMVAATAWQWMRKPPAVGYYVCGVLGLVNLGFIMTSREFLPHDKVSLVRASVYILYSVMGDVMGDGHENMTFFLDRV